MTNGTSGIYAPKGDMSNIHIHSERSFYEKAIEPKTTTTEEGHEQTKHLTIGKMEAGPQEE